MENPLANPSRQNSLLLALDFVSTRFEAREGWRVVRCLQFPQIQVETEVGSASFANNTSSSEHGDFSPCQPCFSGKIEEAFEEARKQALALLELGETPSFGGTGRSIWSDFKLLKPLGKGGMVQIKIPDEWCLLSSEDLEIKVRAAAQFWVKFSGKGVGEPRNTSKANIEELNRFILDKVEAHRPKFHADEEVWDARWAEAKKMRTRELEIDGIYNEQLQLLIEEALRYVSEGGTLRVPWMVVGEGDTPAETWLLYQTEQFNAMSKEPVTHVEESRDELGQLLKYRSWVENPAGGEIKTAGDQAEFMVGRMGRRAQDGSEAALRRLHRIAAEAIRRFWVAVDAQPELARVAAPSWLEVPVMMNSSPLSKKELEKKLLKIPLAPPPSHSPRLDPNAPYHEEISRISEAVWWLLSQPPVTFPFSGVHDASPDWLKEAWRLDRENNSEAELYARRVFWKVKLAADQYKSRSSEKSPLKRADKERERFVEAVVARIAKPPQG